MTKTFKMAAVSKEKQQNSLIKWYGFGVKEFIQMINLVTEGLNDTKI
jgi:hypothetical protein